MQKILERGLESKLEKLESRKEIIGIRGARQTGKTTLLKLIEGKTKADKAFINLDQAEYRRALEDNPLDFVKRFKKNGKLVLFLDEIQKVKEGGEKLKIIYDEFPDVKIFFSGSSSLEIKTNILPCLVGRLFLFELYTFDFDEFLSLKAEGLLWFHRASPSTTLDKSSDSNCQRLREVRGSVLVCQVSGRRKQKSLRL